MQAMSEAIVIKKPADAARAPLGYTYTATGTGEARTSLIIVLIEVE
jgi:hypothetical protein